MQKSPYIDADLCLESHLRSGKAYDEEHHTNLQAHNLQSTPSLDGMLALALQRGQLEVRIAAAPVLKFCQWPEQGPSESEEVFARIDALGFRFVN